MEQYADDLRALLDSINVKQAVIGGLSMGGYIALAFIAQYPDRVKGLILANTRALPDSERHSKLGLTNAARAREWNSQFPGRSRWRRKCSALPPNPKWRSPSDR